jgi:hypothetical protein
MRNLWNRIELMNPVWQYALIVASLAAVYGVGALTRLALG